MNNYFSGIPIIFDLEFTSDSLLEIGAIKCSRSNLSIIDSFSQKCKPKNIASLNSKFEPHNKLLINKTLLDILPREEKILANFFKWLPENPLFIGYSILNDLNFLQKMVDTYNIGRVSYRYIDVYSLVETAIFFNKVNNMEERSLVKVYNTLLNKELEPHIALNDCQMVLELTKYFLKIN